MNWERFDTFVEMCNRFDVNCTLGVIPKNEDPFLSSANSRGDYNFWQVMYALSRRSNWTIAVHGYRHVYSTHANSDNYLGIYGPTEFAGVDLDSQIRFVKAAMEIFSSHDIYPKSFFAPSHTFDRNTLAALRLNGIEFVVDGYDVLPYSEDGLIFVPQLFGRLTSTLSRLGMVGATAIHIDLMTDDEFFEFLQRVKTLRHLIIPLSYSRKFSERSKSRFNSSILSGALGIKRMFV